MHLILRLKNKILADNIFHQLLKESSIAFINKISGHFLGLILTILISRWYGVSNFGIVAIVTTVLNFVLVFSRLGLDTTFMRLSIEKIKNKKNDEVKTLFFQVFAIMGVWSLVIACLIYVNAGFISMYIFKKPYLKEYIEWTAFAIVPSTLTYIFSEGFRAFKKAIYFIFFNITCIPLFALILTFGFGNGHIDSAFYPLLFRFIAIVTTFLIGLITFLNFSRILSFAKGKATKLKELFDVGIPIMVTNSMSMLMHTSGILILGIMSTDAETGIFKAVSGLSVFTSMSLIAVNSISAPKFAEAFAGNNLKYIRNISHKTTRMIFWSSLPILLSYLLFPKFILSVMGRNFESGWLPLVILTIGQFYNAISGSVAMILNMTKKQVVVRNNAIVAALINVVLCLLLIPRLGAIGAALATAMSTIMYNTQCIYFIAKYYKFITIYIPGVSRTYK